MYGYGNSMFLATHGILARGGTPPANTVAPVISGTAQEGQTMTCSTGTWTGDAPITYAYQWKRNGSDIGSATNSTYTLVTADVGQSILCTVTATNGAGSASADSNTVTPIAAFDPDAQAFITAAGITDPTQQSAINQLVVDLKGYSIWTNFKAIYPVVGGTSSSHAVNLKSPGTYNLSFTTGWTHASTGMTPNGTSAYADTSLIPSSVLSLNSTHISGYIRTDNAINAPILSSENASNSNNGLYIWPRDPSNNYSVRINDNTSAYSFHAYAYKGLHVAIRTASNVKKYRLNTNQVFNLTTASSSLNASSIYIGASRNNAYYSNNEIAFSTIGDGLTDTEAANFYTAVQAYQTALSRNV